MSSATASARDEDAKVGILIPLLFCLLCEESRGQLLEVEGTWLNLGLVSFFPGYPHFPRMALVGTCRLTLCPNHNLDVIVSTLADLLFPYFLLRIATGM